VQLCGRTLRVDHVENYRLPKHLAEQEAEKSSGGSDSVIMQPISAVQAGHAYQGTEMASQFTLQQGQDLFAPRPPAQRQEQVHHLDRGDRDETRRRDDSKNSKKDKEVRRLAKETRRRERQAKRVEREERRLRRVQKSMTFSTADGEKDADSDRHKRHRHRRRHDGSSKSSDSYDSDVSRRKSKKRKRS
jgi:septal ring factor EnvC (AmiA/AmiB activator)